MKTLVETWRGDAVNATSDPSFTHTPRAARNWLDACISDFTDACTPRTPKAEWFGTGSGQWDSWWFGECGVMRSCVLSSMHGAVTVDGIDECGESVTVFIAGAETLAEMITECVPVARDGFPAPVGWGVVGG